MRLSGAIDSGDPDMNRLFNSAANARDEDLPDMSSLLANLISGDSRNVFLVKLLRELLIRKVAARLGTNTFAVLVAIAIRANASSDYRTINLYNNDLCDMIGFPKQNPRALRAAIRDAETEGWLDVTRPRNGFQLGTLYRISIPGEYELSEEQGQWCTD